MASFKKDILFYVSRIEKDVESVRQLITMSERADPVVQNTQIPGIESVEGRGRGNARSQVINSSKNGQTVVNDNQIVEGLSRRDHNDNDEVTLVVNSHDATDDAMSSVAEGSVASARASITRYSNEVDTGDLSGKSEKDLKLMMKNALETSENSAKKVEVIKENLRKVRQQIGPVELTESNKTTVLKLKKNMSVHSSIMDEMSSKIEELKKELRSRKMATEKSVGIFVTKSANPAKVSSSAYDPLKRKLDESVVDCGVLRGISKREEEFVVLKKLKKEENPCDDSFECSFCSRSFGSAGPLAAHLVRHYSSDNQKRLDCPWPGCSFVSARPNLTKHMRSKHTKEELFQCTVCLKKFRTMDMKIIHEKKHKQQDEWGHCRTCLRFFKVKRGGCSFCQK